MWIETSSVLRMVSKIDGLYPPDTSVTSVYKLPFCTYGYKFTYCSPLFDFRMLITIIDGWEKCCSRQRSNPKSLNILKLNANFKLEIRNVLVTHGMNKKKCHGCLSTCQWFPVVIIFCIRNRYKNFVIRINLGITFSPDILKMIRSRRMRWVGHVTCMVELRCIQNFGCKAWR
jgi:hypothetical protein